MHVCWEPLQMVNFGMPAWILSFGAHLCFMRAAAFVFFCLFGVFWCMHASFCFPVLSACRVLHSALAGARDLRGGECDDVCAYVHVRQM